MPLPLRTLEGVPRSNFAARRGRSVFSRRSEKPNPAVRQPPGWASRRGANMNEHQPESALPCSRFAAADSNCDEALVDANRNRFKSKNIEAAHTGPPPADSRRHNRAFFSPESVACTAYAWPTRWRAGQPAGGRLVHSTRRATRRGPIFRCVARKNQHKGVGAASPPLRTPASVSRSGTLLVIICLDHVHNGLTRPPAG